MALWQRMTTHWYRDMPIISACNIQSPSLQPSIPQVFIVKTHDSLSPHNKLTLHLVVPLWSNRLNLTTQRVCRVFIARCLSCCLLRWSTSDCLWLNICDTVKNTVFMLHIVQLTNKNVIDMFNQKQHCICRGIYRVLL